METERVCWLLGMWKPRDEGAPTEGGQGNFVDGHHSQLGQWKHLRSLFASLSLGPTATVLSGSIGVIALILLLMGLMSMPLKKWRHESELKGLGMRKGRNRVTFLWGSLGGGG